MASNYERGFSFAGFQANRPATPLPGQHVDIELDSIARAIAALWARGSGGGTPGPALDLPIAALSLKANLLSRPAIPQVVGFDQFKQELGIGSGGGGLPDWSDVQNKPVFGNAAQRNVGAAAGTVAAGDDARIVNALQALQNGMDIPNKGVFRSNLGLGPAALLAVGMTAGTVAAGDDPRFVGAGVKTIKDYGAKMDGVTDDYAAMQAMFTETGTIVIGPGTTYTNQRPGTINATKGVKVMGSGVGHTIVLLGSNGGFDVSGLGFEVSGIDFRPAPGVIVQLAIKAGRPRYSSEDGLIRGNRFRANSASSYIAQGCECTQVWYSHIENNHFHGENYSGNGFKFNYSVNITAIGNFFLFMDTPYHWTTATYPRLPDEPIAAFTCEGHMIVGNVCAFNRVHFLFEAGLYPVLEGNIIDLCKPDGNPIISYAFLTTVIGNWFAVVQGQGDPGAPLRFHDSDCHVIMGNTWAGNDTLGTCLVLTNCNFCQIIGNNFRFYKNQLSATNCDSMIVALNVFVGFANVAANLGGVTGLRWIGNVMRGGGGSYGPGAILPNGVYDPTDTVALNAAVQQSTQAALSNAGVTASFHTQRAFTVGAAASAVSFPVGLPGGRFSGSPVYQATLSDNYGALLDIRVQGDASQATIFVVRNDGGQIPAGAVLDISLSVFQPNG